MSVLSTADGTARIRYLRGVPAAGMSPPSNAVDRLVRGDHQAEAAAMPADPVLTFAEVVLLDLDRTSAWLTAIARHAKQRRETGSPGFRPGCAILRRDERQALS